MKIDKASPRHWMLLAKQALYTWMVILCRPIRRTPTMPIAVLYGHQFSGNLKALYEAWEKDFQEKMQLYFLTLDEEQAQRLKRENVCVLRCSRPGDMLVLSRASAMITDHGLHAMEPLVRFTDLKFIDVWHGIPFKGFIPSDFRLQHRYDEVWVPSELLKSLYVERFGFSPGKVRPLGYARTDKLFRRPPPPSHFRRKNNIPPSQKLVLYAPTWQQDDAGRTLFPFGNSQTEFTKALASTCALAGAKLVIRSHLNAAMDRHESADVSYCSQKDYADTEDLLLGTDILVCDWSSIAFDFLALERPTLFLDVPAPFKHGFSLGPEYRFGCVVADIETLTTRLQEFLASPSAYWRQHTGSHKQIAGEIYGRSDLGNNAAQRQLQHLVELTAKIERRSSIADFFDNFSG